MVQPIGNIRSSTVSYMHMKYFLNSPDLLFTLLTFFRGVFSISKPLALGCELQLLKLVSTKEPNQVCTSMLCQRALVSTKYPKSKGPRLRHVILSKDKASVGLGGRMTPLIKKKMYVCVPILINQP